MTRFKSHGRIYSVFLLLILVLAILLLTGCNQQTAYDISEDLPTSDFTDAQLEFFQNNIGRTEQDKQIVLYRNIEDSGKWAYVYTWFDDGPTYVRYLFCDDNDEYQNRYEEIDCLWYSVWYDKTIRREIFRNHGSSMYKL